MSMFRHSPLALPTSSNRYARRSVRGTPRKYLRDDERSERTIARLARVSRSRIRRPRDDGKAGGYAIDRLAFFCKLELRPRKDH